MKILVHFFGKLTSRDLWWVDTRMNKCLLNRIEKWSLLHRSLCVDHQRYVVHSGLRTLSGICAFIWIVKHSILVEFKGSYEGTFTLIFNFTQILHSYWLSVLVNNIITKPIHISSFSLALFIFYIDVSLHYISQSQFNCYLVCMCQLFFSTL